MNHLIVRGMCLIRERRIEMREILFKAKRKNSKRTRRRLERSEEE